MSKTYTDAPEAVYEKIAALLQAYYPEVVEAGVTVTALMATATAGNAVTHGGYAATAVIRAVSLKDRVKGMRDVEITIDSERYDEMTEAQKDGLLDHELYHIELENDTEGELKRDDIGRPKVRMRKHDWQMGWFEKIAQRHGDNAPECIQAKQLLDKAGQYFFPFIKGTE